MAGMAAPSGNCDPVVNAKDSHQQNQVEFTITPTPIIKQMFIEYVPRQSRPQGADWSYLKDCLPNFIKQVKPSIAVLRALPQALSQPEGFTVVYSVSNILSLEQGDTLGQIYGIAFDLGTTTIAGALINLDTGQSIATKVVSNRQGAYGDDLTSRLAYSLNSPAKLEKLSGILIRQLNALIDQLLEQSGVERRFVYETIAMGNTVMCHYFCQFDTTHLGITPYAPVIENSLKFSCESLGLNLVPTRSVFMPDCINGSVGSDATAVLLCTGLAREKRFEMVIDTGTNGLIALGNKDRLMVCSCSTGPAFEGGRISHGIKPQPGAIAHICWQDDHLDLEVIDNRKIVGVCGSAVIDLCAILLDFDLLDTRGYLKASDTAPQDLTHRLVLGKKKRDSYFILQPAGPAMEDIIVTQQDIRELQLAKAAIRAGQTVLQSLMDVPDEALGVVYLSGGFYSSINTRSAVRIGLVPDIVDEHILYVGNGPLTGAQMALCSTLKRQETRIISQTVESIVLSEDETFQAAFSLGMKFPANSECCQE
jgi:uncharacterized 2Fe-2S/4Fe-4S cluster protein (DUF4445 family)